MSLGRMDVVLDDGAVLAAVRQQGPGPSVLLLHAGVADLRSWSALAEEPAVADLDLIAYDRRGFGSSPAGVDPAGFTHVADLVAVLDAADVPRALVVGNSMGGALAIDLALTAPERVAGVLLLGAGVSGMTDDDTPFDWAPDPATEPLLGALEAAGERHDLQEQARLLAHLWLDGPAEPEGRVAGPVRDLFLHMNRRILEVAAPDEAGDAGLDAWTRLSEIDVPVRSAWGALDVPCDLPFYEETARRLGQGPGRVLPGVAHLPGLETPALVAELVREALPS